MLTQHALLQALNARVALSKEKLGKLTEAKQTAPLDNDGKREFAALTASAQADARAAAKLPLYVQRLFESIAAQIHPTGTATDAPNGYSYTGYEKLLAQLVCAVVPLLSTLVYSCLLLSTLVYSCLELSRIVYSCLRLSRIVLSLLVVVVLYCLVCSVLTRDAVKIW